MSEIEIRVKRLSDEVGAEIATKIEQAIERSSPKIARGMEEASKARVRNKRAVFSGDLLDSFRWSVWRAEDGLEIRFSNNADHASYIDQGVRGVRAGSGPHAYSTFKPPLASLLPWVDAKLSAWTVIELPDGQKKLVPKE